MCGLVGMAGNLNSQTSKMFRLMLLFDVIRGEDSTGVAVVGMGANKAPEIEKDLGCPPTLWEWGSKLFTNRGQLKVPPKVVIGHNRAATMGVINVDNAHPFQYGNITGAHNGTLTDWSDLENYKEHEVDSRALFDTINTRGIVNTWASFRGAAAITYWNEKDETLNLIRNNQRPLFIARSASKQALFWASEPWMIAVAADKAGVKLACDDDGKPIIAPLEEDNLYTYKPTSVSCPFVSKTPLQKKPSPPTNTYGTNTVVGGNVSSGKNNWSAGKKKADKDLVGRTFKLLNVVGRFYQPKEWWVRGLLSSGEEICIYPLKGEDIDAWDALCSATDVEFKLTHRPRYSQTKFYMGGQSGVKTVFHIASTGVDKVAKNVIQLPPPQKKVSEESTGYVSPRFVSGPNGYVTEARWKEITSVNGIKGCCSCCNNPLNIEQHSEYLWPTYESILCSSCQEDPMAQGFFNISGKGA